MILVGGEGADILVILLLPLSRLQFEDCETADPYRSLSPVLEVSAFV